MSRYIDADLVYQEMMTYSKKTRDMVMSILDELPTIEIPTWIPCSEKLPKPRESVLLAVNSKYGDWVGEGCYWETTDHHAVWKGYRWNATYWDDEIIAWQPLPQPYREGE